MVLNVDSQEAIVDDKEADLEPLKPNIEKQESNVNTRMTYDGIGAQGSGYVKDEHPDPNENDSSKVNSEVSMLETGFNGRRLENVPNLT